MGKSRSIPKCIAQPLAKAPTIMAAPPTPPAPDSPEGTRPTPIAWADDAEAKALLAEAAALIEGNAEAPAPK